MTDTDAKKSPVSPTLEKKSRSLDFSPDQWRSAMATLADYGAKYLETNASGPAFRPVGVVHSGRPSPPDSGQTLAQILAEYDRLVLASGIMPTSGRFFGYIPGGGMPASALGDCLAALTNPYAGTFGASPGAADIENQVVRWLRDLLGWPERSWGTLQSGGSLATMTALVAARSTRPIDQWSMSVIYTTEQTHHCFRKATVIVGLDSAQHRYVPTDASGRMSPAVLSTMIQQDIASGLKPWIVCASAGTTNLGAVDPLIELAAVCRQHGLWMHVDAAYGGFFWLTDEGKKRLAGLDLCDSIVLDPHKGLFQPYGVGIVLVNDAELLRRSLASSAAYLRDLGHDEHPSPMDYSPELTRHFRALRLWVALKHHGIDSFAASLDEKLQLADYAWAELSADKRIVCFARPELSVVAFRSAGATQDAANSSTKQLLAQLLQRGRVHVSSTEIEGTIFIRICILSFRSHFAEVEECLNEIRSCLLD